MTCQHCRGRGVVMASLRNPGNDQPPGDYVFRCGCSAGQIDIRSYPVWRTQDAVHYLPEWEVEGVTATPPPPPVNAERKATVLPPPPPRQASPDFFDGCDD